MGVQPFLWRHGNARQSNKVIQLMVWKQHYVIRDGEHTILAFYFLTFHQYEVAERIDANDDGVLDVNFFLIMVVESQ